MTTLTAARRIEQLKEERNQLRADLERARMWAVEMEGRASAYERLLAVEHASLATLLDGQVAP